LRQSDRVANEIWIAQIAKQIGAGRIGRVGDAKGKRTFISCPPTCALSACQSDAPGQAASRGRTRLKRSEDAAPERGDSANTAAAPDARKVLRSMVRKLRMPGRERKEGLLF
jgi:hypothetical protein